jgi:hypothetical protein
MIPIGFFILLVPYLKFNWRLLIIVVAITSILVVILFRTNILKIVISFLILSFFYFRNILGRKMIRITQLFLFILPIVLLFTGITGTFNIFEGANNNKDYTYTTKAGNQQNLTVDTRTFLYVEVLSSMKSTKEWLIGKSATGSYYSKAFNNLKGVSKKGHRYGSEVNLLNILLYHGIIGVLIYFMLLFTISTVAIKYSNNILSQMVGLLIASRWTLSFIEEFTQFDLNFYFFWLFAGIVSIKTFREFSDTEIKQYLRIS